MVVLVLVDEDLAEGTYGVDLVYVIDVGDGHFLQCAHLLVGYKIDIISLGLVDYTHIASVLGVLLEPHYIDPHIHFSTR